MDNIVSALELRDALIALLEQADPDTHMELPVDVDGVPIHIGDKVTEHEDGHDFVVDGYEYDGKWWVFHIDGIRAPAHMCTHYSAKELLMKFGCLYNSINYDGIPALVEEYVEKLKEVMADEIH